MMRRLIASGAIISVFLAMPAYAQVPMAMDTPMVMETPMAMEPPVAGSIPYLGGMPPVMDQSITSHFLLEQNEGRFDGRGTDYRWEARGWIGTDYDKFLFKTEGLRTRKGAVEDSQQTLLYSRAISTYFDLQGGVRADVDSRTGRTWGAFGFQGLAPNWFDVEAMAYISDRGHLALRLAASYDLQLTQRLILQPQIEMNLYSQDDPGRLVGSGLSNIEAGVRLRYEITRKFAPYIGVHYEGRFGRTATLVRRDGDNPNAVAFVFGVRSWF